MPSRNFARRPTPIDLQYKALYFWLEIELLMLDYIDNQLLLKGAFSLEKDRCDIPETDTRIINCRFMSDVNTGTPTTAEPVPDLLLRSYAGNRDFSYPVFMPGGKETSQGAILMLHGLNERSWSKYLYWAQNLAEQTCKAVILFPIAWHINRSPSYWADPRQMQTVSQDRTQNRPGNLYSTPFNAALSTRLDTHPEWFCTSGLHTCYDIIALAGSIKNGDHPLFEKGSSLDFFAYSVGAFLLEVLLIADPDGLFENSRSFLFLGGSSFEQMKGISKYIMDSGAFSKLEDAFIRQDPQEVRHKIHLPQLSHFNLLWSSFMSMLRLDRLQAFRERSFRRIGQRIMAVGLTNDRVIPGKSILRTLWGAGNRNQIPVTILDFPYPYLHENPFPINLPEYRPAVDHSFRQIFNSASRFLS